MTETDLVQTRKIWEHISDAYDQIVIRIEQCTYDEPERYWALEAQREVLVDILVWMGQNVER